MNYFDSTCVIFTCGIHTLEDTSIAINRYIIWRWLTLEAYFHNDPRIEEWVNEITEKIFTVCSLTGADAEVEFQNGCQIVSKIANILQGISIFPSEYLEDGLKQLLEQQLPDTRVINNFPTFQDTMKNMIREGMKMALDPENDDMGQTAHAFRNNDVLEKTANVALENSIEPCEDNIESSIHAYKEKLVPEKVIDCFLPVVSTIDNNNKITNQMDAGSELQFFELADLIVPSKDGSTNLVSPVVPSAKVTPTKAYGIMRKTETPEHAECLKQVLANFFPNVSVSWNFNLKGQKFLAQVADILIWLNNPEQSCAVEDLNKEGWKVYECSSTDLMFPRRLERGIRQIQRLGKKYRNV